LELAFACLGYQLVIKLVYPGIATGYSLDAAGCNNWLDPHFLLVYHLRTKWVPLEIPTGYYPDSHGQHMFANWTALLLAMTQTIAQAILFPQLYLRI
jgi:hypothetical protein